MMKILLYPFSILFKIIISIRHWLFDLGILKSETSSIPSINIGNITVGGTGKTPHIEYLISLLSQHYKIATLSRGYQRKTKGFRLADQHSSVQEIGDEPTQIKWQYPNIQVAVDEKRVRGCRQLKLLSPPPDVILLDDAFQHRYIRPSLNIMLSDYKRPYWKDHLLPYGSLRDLRSRSQKADIIIISKAPFSLSIEERQKIIQNIQVQAHQNVFFTGIHYDQLIPLNNKTQHINASTSVLLVTAIAQSHYLKEHLSTRFEHIQEIKYPDHYDFKIKDIQKIIETFHSIPNDNKIIITTVKDTVKLKEQSLIKELQNYPVYYQTIKVQFIDKNEEEQFNKIIINTINNKSEK